MAPKRSRSIDYSEKEIRVLVDGFVKNHKVLSAKHSNLITSKRKEELYQEICEAVNAIGIAPRTVESVKDKWQTLKRNVKAKRAKFLHQAKREGALTGGGEGNITYEEYSEVERSILGVIPPESMEGKPL